MTSLTDDAKAVLVLASRLGDRQRPSLPAGAWHKLAAILSDQGLALQDLFSNEISVSEIPGLDRDTSHRIEALIDGAAAVTFEYEELDRKGVSVVTIGDGQYPAALRQRLGSAAPPVFYSVGEAALLSRGGIAIVGSRNVEPQGAELAQDVAREAASRGHAVVSGGARGVDQLAMNAAFRANGQVVGVLADSLLRRIRKPDILRAIDSGSTCLVTQQHPDSGFSPAAAMSRNKLVYALSDLGVVVATDHESGGTWAGAIEAMQRGYGRVAVWRGPGEGAGNAALEERGAMPFGAVDDLWRLLDARPEEPPEQMSMLR